jgi:hypothetical protein
MNQKNDESPIDHDADLNWKNRVLCSDPACIGIIGPGGRCKECDLPYEGELPVGGFSDETEPEPESGSSEPDAPEPEDPISETDDDVPTDDKWESRVLCSDQACIGVIGPDGRCKECGLPLKKN